jgi:hypothetical protein
MQGVGLDFRSERTYLHVTITRARPAADGITAITLSVKPSASLPLRLRYEHVVYDDRQADEMIRRARPDTDPVSRRRLPTRLSGRLIRPRSVVQDRGQSSC